MASPEDQKDEPVEHTLSEPAEEGAPVPTEDDRPVLDSVAPEEILPEEPEGDNVVAMPVGDAELKAVLEAIIYVTDEPLSLEQICTALLQPQDRVIQLLDQLAED